MKKSLKVLASALTVLLVTTALVGCGKSSDSSSSTSEGKTITVWSHLNPSEVKEVQKAADEWAKKTGNKVKVQEDKSDFQAFLQAANSSKGPDMMFGMPHNDLGTFQKANLLAEVPADVMDASKYVPLAMDAVTWSGKKYAVPVSMETYALFYNTEKVSKAPATYDELIAQAKKTGFQYDINNFYFTYGFIAGNGGYVFKSNGGTLDPKDIGLGNEGAVKAYQALADMTQKDKLMPATIKGDDAKAAFQKNTTSMYISGPWDVEGFTKAGTKFAVAPLPQVNGKPCPSFVGVQSAFVSAKSKNQKETWDLMKYLTENTAMPLFKAGNRIPVLKSELAKEDVTKNANVMAFAEQAKNGQPMPNIAEMSAVWKPVGDNLGLVTAGKLSPADAGKKIVEQINQGLAQQK